MPNLSRRELGLALAAFPLTVKAETAFKMKRGVALYPWFSETMEFPHPSISYSTHPYNPRRNVPTIKDLRQIKSSGLDHVRLPIDPAPFLSGELWVQKQLLNQVQAAVNLILAQGLGVIINFHPNESTHYWTSRRMMAGGNDEIFMKYLALCTLFAKIFKTISPDKLAFEPMNEPKFPPNSREWEAVQLRLYAAIRTECPKHTIILTGAEGSLIHGLSPFNPKGYDENTLFTFHFYEPFHFTHQGAKWTSAPLKYIAGLHYPASMGMKETAYEMTAKNIIRQVEGEAAQKKAFDQAKPLIDKYYAANNGLQMIKDHFGVVERWATQHNIALSRLYLGEFGVVKSSLKGLAAEPEDRARWLKDVRVHTQSLGMAWNFWNYFEVMSLVEDDVTRKMDKPILEALGLSFQ